MPVQRQHHGPVRETRACTAIAPTWLLFALFVSSTALAQPGGDLTDSTGTATDSLAVPTATTGGGGAATETWINNLLGHKFTDRIRLPIAADGSTAATLGQAWAALDGRLARGRYTGSTVYAIDSSGFAIVCPVEHIGDNGKRKSPGWGWERSTGLRAWLASVFGTRIERYRVLMILVPGAPPEDDSLIPDQDYTDRLTSSGGLALPPARAGHALPDSFCELRVLEFSSRDEDTTPTFLVHPTLTARRQAERSGLWTNKEIP